MLKLEKSNQAWGTTDFTPVLKKEITQLDHRTLPLQQGLSIGSYALGKVDDVIVIAYNKDETSIYIKLGLFYRGIIAGCSCADDPTPQDQTNEYCEVQVDINIKSSEAIIVLKSSG